MTILDDLLVAAGRVDDPSPETLERARTAVLTAAASCSAPADQPRRGRRRTLALGTAAAAAVAAVITVPVISLAGHGPSATATAATVLRQAGDAAGRQSGGWPGAAYWHVSSTYVQAGGRTHRRDIWIAHHGRSVLRDNGLPTGVGGKAESLPVDSTFAAGGTSLTWDELYALPTDPGRLAHVLRRDVHGAGKDPTSELFVAVGDLLRETPASPALRHALYDVAAAIPGVHLVGRMTDGAGRTGVGVERGGETYVIDPTTGALLADSDGHWTGTYLHQGPSNSAPALPAK